MTATRACDALVFVTATNTEIGKTWWAAAVAGDLRARGCYRVARKPDRGVVRRRVPAP